MRFCELMARIAPLLSESRAFGLYQMMSSGAAFGKDAFFEALKLAAVLAEKPAAVQETSFGGGAGAETSEADAQHKKEANTAQLYLQFHATALFAKLGKTRPEEDPVVQVHHGLGLNEK
eukprot:g10665.t1